MANRLVCAGLGALLMYLLDPKSGRRRRKLVADQLTHLNHVAERGAAGKARHIANRARGIKAELSSLGGPRGDGATAQELGRLAQYVGSGLAYMVAARRGGVGTKLVAALAAKAALRSIYGGRRRRSSSSGDILVQKSITIDAPIDEVFTFWSDYRSFPQFMRNVRDVQELGDNRSRWTVSGPAGVPVEWTAVITDLQPERKIAWRTEEGSMVSMEGVALFEPVGNGSTRVDVKLSYRPPLGSAGHSVAWLFGADPKHELDQDLMRMKGYLETGIPARDAYQPIEYAGPA